MPGYMRSAIFRAKMRAAFGRAEWQGAIDPAVWTRPWTVHVEQIGSGAHATRYLARYVYHVALTNHRLESFALRPVARRLSARDTCSSSTPRHTQQLAA